MKYNKFTFFWRGPFSQWHPSVFTIDGVTYNCAEQYMMAEKAKLFNDYNTLEKIIKAKKPNLQQKLGREVNNFKKEIWEEIEDNGKPRCWNIVRIGNFEKFNQSKSPKLIYDLLKTEGTLLVEASPIDVIWGIGLSEDDPNAKDSSKWRGTNWLGEVLTDVRDEFLKFRDELVFSL